ncbi:biotin/lipoyl-binding protein [Paenirhodobacter sp.]|uniref:biotin/lipoyl-binding protein n=1 Tax=Paenirhodobacter sp. TaxID=1965326 RepID=UPI003B41BF65
MKTRNWVVIALVAAVLAAGGYWTWGRGGASDKASAPQTAQVTRGTVQLAVLATGQIQAKQLVSVGGRVSGQVETLAVALGDTVKPGDLIVQIELARSGKQRRPGEGQPCQYPGADRRDAGQSAQGGTGTGTAAPAGEIGLQFEADAGNGGGGP